MDQASPLSLSLSLPEAQPRVWRDGDARRGSQQHKKKEAKKGCVATGTNGSRGSVDVVAPRGGGDL